MMAIHPFTSACVIKNRPFAITMVDHAQRKIHEICVEHAKMPRLRFVASFPNNETNLGWVDGEISAAQPSCAAILGHNAEAVMDEQRTLAAIEERAGITVSHL